MSDFTPPDRPLQFDTAEFTSPTPANRRDDDAYSLSPLDPAESVTEPVPSGPVCSVCKKPVADSYYLANKTVLCEQCCGAVKEHFYGGSKTVRFLAASAMGFAAAVAGAVLWYVVRAVTGYQLGLIAIVVGLMVGVAVRKGSKGRGGWGYQLLAVALTYFSISVQYLPDLLEAAKHHGKAPAAVGNGPARAAGKPAAANNADDDAPDAARPNPLFALAVILVVVLAMPILLGMHSPISLLIAGIGLYEAWKINKSAMIEFMGPFRVGPQPVPGMPDL
jgi:hypothetical protein